MLMKRSFFSWRHLSGLRPGPSVHQEVLVALVLVVDLCWVQVTHHFLKDSNILQVLLVVPQAKTHRSLLSGSRQPLWSSRGPACVSRDCLGGCSVF